MHRPSVRAKLRHISVVDKGHSDGLRLPVDVDPLDLARGQEVVQKELRRQGA